jgi:tetratricopeptide (TPR) repeat protein
LALRLVADSVGHVADPLIERVRAAFLANDVTGAEAMLRRRLSVEPRDSEARIELARLLRYKGQFQDSLAELDRAASPANGWAAPLLRASLLSRLGRHDEAIVVQRYAIEHEGEHPRALLGLAHVLKTVGKIEEAAAASRRALEIDPRLGEAWWTLSSLRTVDFSEEDRSAMGLLLSDPTLNQDSRMYVHFALARAFDAADDPAASWQHLSAANGIRSAQVKHDPNTVSTLVDETIARMTADVFSSRADWGHSSNAPIFVVGMPRSGSTLLEQMLASHSQIEGTIELPDIPAVVRQMGGTGRHVDASYLRTLLQLDRASVRELGEAYLDRSRTYRVLSRPFFVDKMPNNWLFTGFIRLILPNAKIIDVRRHPMDCGFSNYREFFARGQSYSSDLTHIARFYGDYVRLMRHFDQVQPGKVHRVNYERLVENPEQQLRSLFEYLDLPFEPQVLQFHQTQRGVRTASAAQVRQPLNRKGIGQWRRYADWLGPLEDALGPVLQHWDD